MLVFIEEASPKTLASLIGPLRIPFPLGLRKTIGSGCEVKF